MAHKDKANGWFEANGLDVERGEKEICDGSPYRRFEASKEVTISLKLDGHFEHLPHMAGELLKTLREMPNVLVCPYLVEALTEWSKGPAGEEE